MSVPSELEGKISIPRLDVYAISRILGLRERFGIKRNARKVKRSSRPSGRSLNEALETL